VFAVPITDALTKGQSILLHIRPYDILFADKSTDKNVLTGTVKQATYLGNIIDYRVILPGNIDLRVQSDTFHRFKTGDQVQLHLPPERCHLIAEE
jgi:ABC-type Fe3+/spermidine/putrescine transport system ATPase subunit